MENDLEEHHLPEDLGSEKMIVFVCCICFFFLFKLDWQCSLFNIYIQ